MAEQELIQEFNELEADSNFISEKSLELSQKYARKFVAIKDQQVIAVGDNFEDVLNEIKEKGIDASRILIEYIPDKGEIILY
ncbi:MAG: DUF5678 domain-containing protein [Candidatus Pacearchaeota archaeon]|nr:DUF5678 domain-containing protein [Candidatus Pacearchaeota archaeon]